jgi:hypothetical protein
MGSPKLLKSSPGFLIIRTHIAQPLVPYSDMKNLGNHNKDSTQFFIRSTKQ